jgi:ankyrin repeat protein
MIPATDLEYWASLGNLTMVKMALAANPDPNIRGQGGYTAMHAAAENGHIEVLRFLAANGADPNSRTSDGKTPLDFAEATGREAVIRAMRDIGGRRGGTGASDRP